MLLVTMPWFTDCAAPSQVMATDELTGSLRSIKPCAVVAKDRFKSIQKRGLVEVTKKQAKVGVFLHCIVSGGACRASTSRPAAGASSYIRDPRVILPRVT